jgi:hypothetical protein
MPSRPSNLPQRKITVSSEDLTPVQKQRLLQQVRYQGSGNHKRFPLDHGLSNPSPRPSKSLCDLARAITKVEAQALLRRGVEEGLYSVLSQATGLPKYIWSVNAECDPEEVFEAKTDASDSVNYHGYPLERGDPQYEYVLKNWRARCLTTGQ